MILVKFYVPLTRCNASRYVRTSRFLYSTTIKYNGEINSGEDGSIHGSECEIESPTDPNNTNDVTEVYLEEDMTSELAGGSSRITRGKKIRPSKANIVVLDHKQAGLLRKKEHPDYFRKRRNEEKLSILEGVELGSRPDMRRNNDSNSTYGTGKTFQGPSSQILREIESQRRQLLVFKSSVSREQAVKSISYQRPSSALMSTKRYDQLKQLLDSAYTLPQLRAYTKKYFNVSHSKTNKVAVIQHIMNDYWKCTTNDLIKESEDLIFERIIDISIRDMYLLLLTDNGKILNNFARIGATVAVALDENIVIVRATAPIIKYVEVSLSKILANVDSANLPVKDIISNHTARGSTSKINIEELISMVQRESDAYFEKYSLENEEDGNNYNVSAFGSKRVSKAKNLLLWGVQYHPQLTEKIDLCGDDSFSSFKYFPFSNTECLDWINRTKDWYRLQQPLSIKAVESSKSRFDHNSLSLADHKLDDWYDFLLKQNNGVSHPGITSLKTTNEPSKIFSMTLGQILATLGGDLSDRRTFFAPKISQITTKLLELPLYDSISSKDELYTVDQHEYFVQLKFIPDLSTVPEEAGNAPPVEFYFELDDYDNAITSSMRCLAQLEQRSVLLQTSQLQHDYKISCDTIAELTEIFEENQEKWLDDQPGIQKFLRDSQLTFNSKKRLIIPRSMTVNLPRVDEDGSINPLAVQYDHVNETYHRVLRLMYMDKYLVQFSDVNCGSLGGRYTQVEFIGGEVIKREEFKQFVRDVLRSF